MPRVAERQELTELVVVKTFMDLILLDMEDVDEIAAEIGTRGEGTVEKYREESAEAVNRGSDRDAWVFRNQTVLPYSPDSQYFKCIS
jgi:hypothetical protein